MAETMTAVQPKAARVDRAAIEQAQALLAALRPRLAGEARFDGWTRLYSTDASLYQVMPVGVVLPRTDEDVHATLQVARDFGVPIVPRGGGSSLEGQTVGTGIVIDFSKYMNRVLEVDEEAQTARVQPGMVLDPFNREMQRYGLMYGPDPASSNRATFGGMIGNNSTGAHSILYGMSHDNVQALRVLLADGTETVMAELTPAELDQKLRLPTHEGEVYRLTKRLADQHRAEIAARYPRHWRSVSGYGLDRMVDPETWNLASLLVGSEGTLALSLDATIKLVPRPKQTALGVVHFHTIDEAMEATARILEVGPSAIELIDHFMIDLTRNAPEYARKLTFVEGNPGCVLIVEFYGDSDAELDAKLEGLRAHLQHINAGYALVTARTPAEIGNVWGVRKAGLGLLSSTTSEWKPIPFIEDGSVPPEALPTFVREVEVILKAHGVEAAIFAHASAGCLHIRPMLNMKLADDVEKMRSITEAWTDVIIRLRGSYSGEHGDGRTRTEWNEKLFGSTLYGAFCELKDGWDPAGLFNPGNIVRGQRMTENLRYGESYRAPDVPYTILSFEREGGFAHAVEQCSGIGSCRKTGEGVMCPSYMVTREEEHSTRGRANALRNALSGRVPRADLFSPRMFETLDLCIECKACAAECPSQVDMAKIKYEFLHHYYKEHGLPLRARLFGRIRWINHLGSWAAPVSNWLAQSPPARWAQGRLGIAPQRSLPPFARESFFDWFQHHARHANAGKRGRVVMFPDTFTLYNYPSIGVAATRLIEAAGYEVIVPEKLHCCGRPMISKGMLPDAARNLARNIALLQPYAEQGLEIVGMEPSCLLTFRDEGPELVRGEAARRVAARCYLFDEWLMQRQAAGELDLLQWRGTERTLLFHGHCHHKASGIESAVAALNLPPGYSAMLIEAGCCGMAGSFGFEKEHYDISRKIGEDRLFPTLRDNPDADVAVTGVSCRQQIEHFAARKPKHLVEWLAEDVEE
jgi:FAD/FMN-containing dehydrogenase/Fe-S oxidoreductase